MVHSIKQDHARFRKIVKGLIKKELKKFISHTEMLIKKGPHKIAIPLPHIQIPKFRFSQKKQGGVGQGDGKVGQSTEVGDPKEGVAQAGNTPGQHELEVEVSFEELAELLGEELELPKIQPWGKKLIRSEVDRYKGIASVGPESLRHMKRSMKQALKRQIASGTYDFKNPIFILNKRDLRYRSWRSEVRYEKNAVILYMMDVSGSMGDEQKDIVRTEAFWINTWLKSQYKGVEARYIIHDATAREVDEETFFRTKESGGTLISSAYRLAEKMIKTDYGQSEWNIYPFHFSDGDNWSGEDTRLCLKILKESILPVSNVFCYGQVESRYGSGQFYKDLEDHYGPDHETLILSRIENRDGILNSIKQFLGKGK